MFSADLSWTDDTTEKVGQRRQRRANKRENSVASSNSTTDLTIAPKKGHPDKPSKGSISKVISFSSVKGSVRRPSAASSTQNLKIPSVTVLEAGVTYKDPVEQPDYVYSAKLGPRLPSGAPIESPRLHGSASNRSLRVHAAREQDDAIWEEVPNQWRHGSPMPFGQHRAWSVKNQLEAESICQSYQQVKDEILALRNPNALLIHDEDTFASGAIHSSENSYLPQYQEQCDPDPVELAENLAGRPKSDVGHLMLAVDGETPRTKYVFPSDGFESKLELGSTFRPTPASSEKGGFGPIVPSKETMMNKSPQKVSQWDTQEHWDDVASQPIQIRRILDSDSSVDDMLDEKRQSMFVGTHFQRFVRRMESAGPRIILERLKEEWDEPGDRVMSDELQLEKHLWALTALQLHSMDKRFAKEYTFPRPAYPLPPATPKRRRKILELDGSIGEIYQLSAIYPNSKIYHLTRASKRSSCIPLPSQAVQHEMGSGSPTESLGSLTLPTGTGILPLPYANSSMHHIRSSRLPTLLPASQLPALLAECFRVLKPGGVLELRLMDATPDRRSMGPLLANWLEERLVMGLEQDFRCQRPVMLIPRWASDVGFIQLPTREDASIETISGQKQTKDTNLARCLRLPAAASTQDNSEIVGQVGVLVNRALWKDAWGAYVNDNYTTNWWWEDQAIVQECREWNTTWDVGTIYATKEELS